jgi:hypothetical protein
MIGDASQLNMIDAHTLSSLPSLSQHHTMVDLMSPEPRKIISHGVSKIWSFFLK